MVETNKISLKAQTRTIFGKKVKSLRANGLVPGVIYGHGSKGQSVEIKATDFNKAYQEAGTSALIDLKIDDDKSIKVIAHEPQIDPVYGQALHVDFYQVRMDEKIKTEIPLEFIGESDAVINDEGVLITNRDNIEIECLPNDLIPMIEVNLEALKTFDDQITVSDLKVPATVEILTDLEEVIAFVEPPRSDEELAKLEESAEDAEKEAIEQIAGEETAEGAENESKDGEKDSQEESKSEQSKKDKE